MNKNLPVFQRKKEILKSVKCNDVTIITADTGSGKSTQVPQYLLQEGYRVVVTEPRRVAAVSLANRVSEEISEDPEMRGYCNNIVGYRTAFESTDTENTKILFCTDGLKVARGLCQSKDTVLVIDEVHEWNLNIETLVAWVRHWNNQKESADHNKVKVVIMSATMDASSLKGYFSGNSVEIINCSGTMYDVEMYDRCEGELLDTITDLYFKGKNILVFEPGKSEIQDLIDELRKKIGSEAIILPMHSELSMAEQKSVFKYYKTNKIVVATNIAQTSVTIPDIDAVVDTGIEKVIDTVGGIEGLFPRNISKADCKQRAGRAGRTKDGVYFLCSSVAYNKRKDFTSPEIQRLVLDKVVLKLFSVGIDPRELEFYHKVNSSDIAKSIEVLKNIGALSKKCKLTEDGRKISGMPVSVRYGRMLLEAEKFGCLRDMISAVAIMETGSLVNTRKTNERCWLSRNFNYSDFTSERSSDVLAELAIYKNALNHKYANLWESGINSKNFFRVKEMDKKLSSLMSKELSKESNGSGVNNDNIRYCILCGFIDNIFTEENSCWGSSLVDLNGVSYKQDKNSGTFIEDLIVGMPKIITYKDRYGFGNSLNIVSMCTSIDIDMLTRAVGDDVEVIDDFSNCYFNDLSGAFEGERVYLYKNRRIASKRITLDPLSKKYQEVLEDMKSQISFQRNFYIMPNGTIKRVHDYYNSYIDVSYEEIDLFESYVIWGNSYLSLCCEGFKSIHPSKLKEMVNNSIISGMKKSIDFSLNSPTGSIEKVCSYMIPLCGTKELVDNRHNLHLTVYVGLSIVGGSVANRVFDDENSCAESSKEALQFLANKYIAQNYSDKKFFTFTKDGRKVKTKNSEEAKSVFHDMCLDVLQEVSTKSFKEVLSFIDESYKEAVSLIA